MHRFGLYAIISAMRNSCYNLVHALLVSGVLFIAICSKGISAFWHQFIYGLDQTLSPRVLFVSLLVQSAFFATLIIVCWASTYATHVLGSFRPVPSPQQPAPQRGRALLFTLKIALPVTLVALGLCAGGTKLIEWIFAVTPSEQELVKCFTDPNYTIGFRILLSLGVVILAPLLEELLFRGIVFRGLAKRLPLYLAMALSGFVFALVHTNAGSFLALWYLGVSFAWLYARTRTILAPIALHAIFNLANLVLVFLFPGLAH